MNKVTSNSPFCAGRQSTMLYSEVVNGRRRFINSWHWVGGRRKEVYVYPLFGPKTRLLIGQPEVESDAMNEIMATLDDDCDTVIGSGSFPTRLSNIMITCNLVEHNGTAFKGHKCDSGIDGHVLRIVQNPHQDFHENESVEFNGDARHYCPVGVTTFDSLHFDLLNTETLTPFNFDGNVNIQLHFRRVLNQSSPVDQTYRDVIDETAGTGKPEYGGHGNFTIRTLMTQADIAESRSRTVRIG